MGWIVLNNTAGRALRRGVVDVSARDVIDCAGEFSAGDTVYVTFRAVDGGQYVVATGLAGCDPAALRRKMQARDGSVVVSAQSMALLWP